MSGCAHMNPKDRCASCKGDSRKLIEEARQGFSNLARPRASWTLVLDLASALERALDDLEFDKHDPAHENCRNGLAQVERQLELALEENAASEARHDEIRKLCECAGVHHPEMILHKLERALEERDGLINARAGDAEVQAILEARAEAAEAERDQAIADRNKAHDDAENAEAEVERLTERPSDDAWTGERREVVIPCKSGMNYHFLLPVPAAEALEKAEADLAALRERHKKIVDALTEAARDFRIMRAGSRMDKWEALLAAEPSK